VGYSTIPRCIQSYSASDSEWRNSDRSQVITLEAGGNINITTTGDVTTNCITSTVNCSESVVNATTSTDIVSPLTTVTGNAVITGTLAVNGLTTLGGGFTASAPSAGTNNISGDPTINGGVYSEHEHAGDGGDNETGTTGGVL
jgi:phage baseplate assembly protein gpV